MTSPIRIVLVDDHRVVTRSLKAYLESFPDIKVVGTAVSGEELLEHIDDWKPQIVLQDLLLPGGMDGIEATRRTVERRPEARVIALTASMDEARMRGVLRRLALGLSNREIADALCISEETVKTHVGSVLGKLQVENRAQAIVQALKWELVTLEELR